MGFRVSARSSRAVLPSFARLRRCVLFLAWSGCKRCVPCVAHSACCALLPCYVLASCLRSFGFLALPCLCWAVLGVVVSCSVLRLFFPGVLPSLCPLPRSLDLSRLPFCAFVLFSSCCAAFRFPLFAFRAAGRFAFCAYVLRAVFFLFRGVVLLR